MTALAATMVAGTAFAHPKNEPHVCGIDPDTVLEYPGYAGVQGAYYDRGDYFFGFETVRFQDPISYKHWSRVEAITTHHRLYKDDCRTTQIEIVHTETVDEVVDAAGNGSGNGNEPTESRYYSSPEGTHVFIKYDKQENQIYVYHNDELIADYSGATNWPSNYEGWIGDLKNRTPAAQEEWFIDKVVGGMGNNLTGTVHNSTPFNN